MDKEEFTKNILINDFINEIQKKNYSNNTLMSYINDLYYFRLFVKKDLNNVKVEDIRDYLEYLNLQKEKPASVRRKISSLKSFYKFFVSFLDCFKIIFCGFLYLHILHLCLYLIIISSVIKHFK